MRLFKFLLRAKQSKGHGIHSPFAFEIITNVLNSPYSYYAFTDIPDNLPYYAVQSKRIKKFNHLSFRLVNYCKATNILEINPGDGYNTLYIKSPSSKINYHSISNIGLYENIANHKFDAIFINIDGEAESIPSIDLLLDISHENTFWVINPINTKQSKQFCKLIVNHDSVTVSFDMNDTLIAFLRKSYYKHHYFV
jgi:hypothetical protein